MPEYFKDEIIPRVAEIQKIASEISGTDATLVYRDTLGMEVGIVIEDVLSKFKENPGMYILQDGNMNMMGKFKLELMPNTLECMVSSDVWLEPTVRGYGLGIRLLQLRMIIGAYNGMQSILAIVPWYNTKEQILLNAHGWRQVSKPETRPRIRLYEYNYEDLWTYDRPISTRLKLPELTPPRIVKSTAL